MRRECGVFTCVSGCSSGSSTTSPPTPTPQPAVSVSVTPQYAAVGTGLTATFVAKVTNGSSGVTWTASAGTIDTNGNLVAPSGPQSTTVTVMATSKDDTTKSASATVNIVAQGQVTSSANVQVASYSISPATAGNVSVQFGLDTNYGLTTWTQSAPTGGDTGNILRHLGHQGDFTLVAGTAPIDWFYAQHGPSFTSTNTTGKFSLVVFDNGNDRVFPSGVTCSFCQYSTVPLLDLDETAMTATLTWNPTAPHYSFFGGNAAVLKNGNVEYCESAGPTGTSSSGVGLAHCYNLPPITRLRDTSRSSVAPEL